MAAERRKEMEERQEARRLTSGKEWEHIDLAAGGREDENHLLRHGAGM